MYAHDEKPFSIILLNMKTNKYLILDEYNDKAVAESYRKNYRKILGGKHWTVDRRPGLDTMDHLALTVMGRRELGHYIDQHETFVND